jgi:hypothetical protein
MAIALAAGEQGLTTDRFDYSAEAVAAHIRLLNETGIHPLAEIERAAARTRLPWDLRQPAPSEAEGQEPDDDAGEPAESDTDGAAA